MRWFSMGTQTFSNPKVVRLGEKHGPLGLAWWTALLCNAGAQENGGQVEVSFRAFSFELFATPEEVGAVLDSAVEAGLCHTVSRDVHGFKVEIPAWKRWQDAGRQARARARKKGLEKANVTDGHAEVTASHGASLQTDRHTDRETARVHPYDRKTIEARV